MLINNSYLFKLQLKFPWLSKLITFTDGYVPDEDSDKDYWFGEGKLSGSTLVEDGNWTPHLPEFERQSGRYVETMGCTGYALMNCLEMIAKVKYGHDWNLSDRYTNKMSGTSKNGNSMRTVMNITKDRAGVVPEVSWSWDRDTFNWERYYANIPNEIKIIGDGWLKQYEIKYERVTPNKQLMGKALKQSPLYVAGFAWYKGKDGKYYSYGRANHCYVVIKKGDNNALDSYPPFIKTLDPNYKFGACYKLELYDKDLKYNRVELESLKKRGWDYVMRTDKPNGGKGQMYKITDDLKMVELSEQNKKDLAVQELANRKDLTGISEAHYMRLIK